MCVCVCVRVCACVHVKVCGLILYEHSFAHGRWHFLFLLWRSVGDELWHISAIVLSYHGFAFFFVQFRTFITAHTHTHTHTGIWSLCVVYGRGL